MMKKPITSFLTVIGAFAIVFLCSCSANIEARLQHDGSAEIKLEASLESQIAGLLRRLSTNFGLPFAMDAESMSRSMASAPGISEVHLYNESPTALKGSFSLPKINDFLQTGTGEVGRFIKYSQDNRGGSLAINIDLERSPQLLALFSEDVRNYLAAIMAPAESGIPQSQKEYLEGVASMYGSVLAQEIAGARIKLAIIVPGTIKSIRGGTFSQDRGDFDIPLIDFLVLDHPLDYEIVWQWWL